MDSPLPHKSHDAHKESALQSMEELRDWKPEPLWKRDIWLTRAILLSGVLHLALVIPIILFATRSNDFDLDVEWLSKFEHLVAIGHGQDSGTWAPPENVTSTEFPDENLTSDDGDDAFDEVFERDIEQLLASEKEIEEIEEEPAPEVVEELAPAKEIGKSSAQLQPPDTTKKIEEETKAAPVAKKPFSADKPLPGLDVKGPSELPNLRHYAPGNARLTALLRVDRLRDTSYEPAIRRLIEAVPDYRILLHSTGLDPIRQMDSLFMASADPRYLHETFLAVRHSIDEEELIDVLGKRFADSVNWEKFGEYRVRDLVPETGRYRDPRRILLARPGLTVVGQPEWLETITGPIPKKSALMDHVRDEPQTADVWTLIDGLEHIEHAADKEDTLMLMSAQGLALMLPGVGRLPAFRAARMRIRDASAPKLDVDLLFDSDQEAQAFARVCPGMKRELIGRIPFARALGIATLIDRFQCEASDNYVVVHANYTDREIGQMLQLAMPFIPRPPALTGLPPAPPPPSPPKPQDDIQKVVEGDLYEESQE